MRALNMRMCKSLRYNLPAAALRGSLRLHTGAGFDDVKIQSQDSVLDALQESVKRGEMVHDHAQMKTAKRLSNLQKALNGYCNYPVIEEAEDQEMFFLRRELAEVGENENTSTKGKQYDNNFDSSTIANNDDTEKKELMVPRGFFIFGEVGTGKSHLMDLFYMKTSIADERKRRVHFHSFMASIHKRIHDLKLADLETYGRNFKVDTSMERNPIYRVAVQLAGEISLLCFDEFQVTDVADALILNQLFSILLRRGTVVVATSNRHPSTLYEGGLNRSYFLPFIDLICSHCIVHDMNAITDYRVLISDGDNSLFHVSNPEINQEHHSTSTMKDYRQIIRIKWVDIQKKKEINIAFNRTLIVPEVNQHGTIARFSFNDLCNVELGSSDFRMIAQQFRALIIDDIPLLTLKEHDQARRFITLVDELYEAKCALMCCAVTGPEKLFVSGESELNGLHKDVKDTTGGLETEVGETLGIDVAQSNGMTAGELASVQELSFAFRRAASRLKELTSLQFWKSQGVTIL
mmetsp:Transcript_11036/g.16698  ORF Transcript_11036/g.16698 Transcript_11036/m.16698 type:complete len:520 (-) Transcript_11036:1405-2964(-)